MNTQQRETLEYFREFAADWRRKAEGAVPDKVNNIKQRNDYVLAVADRMDGLRRALDVGCGTGELALDLARRGVHAVGVDFAAEMVRHCEDSARASAAANVEFVEASIFDYSPDGPPFDLVSANGFIEYISEQQLLDFMVHARTLLRPGGSLVVGSRNRLFNVFALNEYTQLEIDNGALPGLLAEAMLLANSPTMEDAIAALAARDAALTSVAQHPSTGIRVTTRHQYAPSHLIRLLAERGFRTAGLEAVHYHGAIPRFGKAQPKVHVAIAELMQQHVADAPYLIPYASTFMLHAVRTDDG
jgi:2-polyprenyl-3-methyl-5-hydroxy-6-metoxy-1,4-benzoquinol methylase